MANPWEKYGAASAGPVTLGQPDPTAPLDVTLKGQAVDKGRRDAANAPFDARKAAADARAAEAAAAKAERDLANGGLAPAEAQQKRARALFDNDLLITNINRARDLIRKGGVTGYGATLKALPATDARELSGLLDTIRGNLTFDRLQQMRDESKTGGAVGNASDADMKLLGSTAGSLDQFQSAESVIRVLDDVDTKYRTMRAQIEGADVNDPQTRKAYGIGDPGKPPAIGDDADKTASFYEIGGPQGGRDGRTLYDGEAPRVENDPTLAGVNARIGDMVSKGAGVDQINAYLRQVGINPSEVQGIAAAVDFRRKNPSYKGAYSVNVDDRAVPMSLARSTLASLSNSPAGAYGVGAANALTAGFLDELAPGNSDLNNAGKQALMNQFPGASLAGALTGGALAAGGAELGAGALGLGRGAPLLADATYGGLFGAGEQNDNRLGGSLSGALAGAGGGMLGRSTVGGAGKALTGVRNEAVRTLADRGVPMTLGQLVGQGGRVGQAVKGVEDRLSGLPFIGDMVNANRLESIRGFNRAAFRDGLAPIGAQATDQVGEGAIDSAQQAVSGGYRQALGGRQVSIDGPFGADLAGAIQISRGIPRVGEEVADTVGEIVPPYFTPQGTLSGDNMQPMLQELRGFRSGYKTDPLGHRVGEAVRGVEDSVTGLFARQAPDVMPALNNANIANANLNVLEDAGLAAINQTDGMFTPAQLNRASRQNTKNYGGKHAAARGDRPFAELGRAGQEVLPSNVPDSGTAGRLAIPIGLTALGGGAGAYNGDATSGFMLGAGAGALLSAPYTRAGQQAIQRLLVGERPDAVNLIGNGLRRYSPRVGGMFGAPLAIEYVNQP